MSARVVEIDPRDITVTPFFKVVNIENIPKSEAEGHAVMEMKEIVEVRFAGSNNYAPVFPAHQTWKREGNRSITYAERWADQYRTFKEGNPQEAMGTPLEMLRPYGVTQEQLSICRVHRIYSVEALNSLEGDKLKSLGMMGNTLKEIARKWAADHSASAGALNEIENLKKRIAELEGAGAVVSTVIPEVEEELYGAMTEDELRTLLETKTGTKPDGRLGHAALVNLAKGL